MPAWLLIALGGATGALARYHLGAWVATRSGGFAHGAPLGTFVINVTGSFLLGAIAMLGLTRGEWVTPEWRLLLGVGFCGAFTTFSTFSVETWAMLQKGQVFEALIYVGASNALGLLAAIAGASLVRATA